jgi:hypothetical protein
MVLDTDKDYNAFQSYFINLFKREKGFSLRPKYLFKLAEKGYISNLSDEKIRKLIPLIKALDSWGDWSFNFELKEKQVKFLGFVVYYEELTVTNIENAKEKIRDCFSILFVNFDGIEAYISAFQFMRTTFTLPQLSKKSENIYLSSHYNSTKRQVFNFEIFNLREQSVCYGDNSEYTLVPSARTTEDFIFVLNIIKGHITWESLDGGPYWKIRNLVNDFLPSRITMDSNRCKNIIRNSVSEETLKKILSYLLSKRIFYFQKGVLKANISDSLIEEIFINILECDENFLVTSEEIPKKLFIENLQNVAVQHKNDISLLSFTDSQRYKPNLFYLFKNKEFFIKVKDYIPFKKNNTDSEVNFYVTSFLKPILTYILNEYVSDELQQKKLDSFREKDTLKTF